MRPIKILFASLSVMLVFHLPSSAQLSPAQPDPLARIRAAAEISTQACSATGESLCEQVAPKIIANAQGDSPLAENVRRLAQGIGGQTAEAQADAFSWAVAAFRAAGVDVHTEKNAVPLAEPEGASKVQEIVVAEIRGREKPDEWVLLGAHLGGADSDTAKVASSVALVIEAARDIQLTGIRPRRSIRFVLFTGVYKDRFGSWAYVRAHRGELDRARAAIIFDGGAGHVAGYVLNGRHDIESGVREALKPIESWGAGRYVFDALPGTDNFDFLLEGIPTILADQEGMKYASGIPAVSDALAKLDIQELKRNVAIAAVTAFGIAERAAPLGPRQSRAEIESLLRQTRLIEGMKNGREGLLWESGQRGRLP